MKDQVLIIERMRRLFGNALNFVETLGLLVVGIATMVAMYHEVLGMISSQGVQLSDLLTLFLFLEVLAMIGRYFMDGKLPVRFPLYIAMVALARTMILDMRDMSEWRMLAISSAILLLTLAVLAIRYGHIRFPYREDMEEGMPPPKE